MALKDFKKEEEVIVSSLNKMSKVSSFSKLSEIMGIDKTRLWRICNRTARLHVYEYLHIKEKLNQIKALKDY